MTTYNNLGSYEEVKEQIQEWALSPVPNTLWKETTEHLKELLGAYERVEDGDKAKLEVTEELFYRPELPIQNYAESIQGIETEIVSKGAGFGRAA